MIFSLIIILPLLSFILLLIRGSSVGTYGSMIISTINIWASFLLSVLIFWKYSFSVNAFSNLWNWVLVDDFIVGFGIRYDSLTAIMFIVVTTISSIVHLYSCVYMFVDPFLTKFMSYLSLFTFFMLILVSSNNFLILFLGWEGVGLCSYLLIGFWSTRVQAGKSATKAFIINKIGDLFLLSGISVTFMLFHSIEFSTIYALLPYFSNNMLEVIGLFLFIGAVGKSAQIGLHTWLPDAMEGLPYLCGIHLGSLKISPNAKTSDNIITHTNYC